MNSPTHSSTRLGAVFPLGVMATVKVVSAGVAFVMHTWVRSGFTAVPPRSPAGAPLAQPERMWAPAGAPGSIDHVAAGTAVPTGGVANRYMQRSQGVGRLAGSRSIMWVRS